MRENVYLKIYIMEETTNACQWLLFLHFGNLYQGNPFIDNLELNQQDETNIPIQ